MTFDIKQQWPAALVLVLLVAAYADLKTDIASLRIAGIADGRKTGTETQAFSSRLQYEESFATRSVAELGRRPRYQGMTVVGARLQYAAS